MAKKRRQRYGVQRRLDLWLEITIEADGFDDAVAKAKQLDVDSFVTPVDEEAGYIDTSMSGLGVYERDD